MVTKGMVKASNSARITICLATGHLLFLAINITAMSDKAVVISATRLPDRPMAHRNMPENMPKSQECASPFVNFQKVSILPTPIYIAQARLCSWKPTSRALSEACKDAVCKTRAIVRLSRALTISNIHSFSIFRSRAQAHPTQIAAITVKLPIGIVEKPMSPFKIELLCQTPTNAQIIMVMISNLWRSLTGTTLN